ncbi:MAG TPA: hypothetical protein VFS40_01740 [Gemmatimonadales bacterium]|nr:hypothetical protein [Gemmatimonadales bacterium]
MSSVSSAIVGPSGAVCGAAWRLVAGVAGASLWESVFFFGIV